MRVRSFRVRSSSAMRIMASLMMSAAVPWIGELIGVCSAMLRRMLGARAPGSNQSWRRVCRTRTVGDGERDDFLWIFERQFLPPQTIGDGKPGAVDTDTQRQRQCCH